MLAGTYKADNNLSLEIKTADSNGKVEGIFRNPNPGHNWECAVEGMMWPWDTLHNRVLLSLSGKFRHNPDSSSEPEVRYEVISVFGHGETSAGDESPEKLLLIQGWANDGPGNEEVVGSQPAFSFVRQ